MLSGFNYLALLHNQYLISIFNCAKPVRHNDNRPAFKKFCQVFHNDPFIICIQGIRGLIKENKPGILVNRTCNQQPLLLSLTYTMSINPYPRIESKGKTPDKLQDISFFSS